MKKIVVATAASAALVLSTTGCAAMYPEHTAVCKVTGKDRTSNHNGGSDMRIYTANCGTFKVADAVSLGHFNSADTFGQIQEGHKYRFTYRGFRAGFFSAFPNILKVQEVK